MEDKIQCPVCKGKVITYRVPLGHGKAVKYICVDCQIIFKHGWTKFGTEGATEKDGKSVGDYKVEHIQFKKVGESKPDEHPNFKPEVYCCICKRNISNEPRETSSMHHSQWKCSDKDKCKEYEEKM